MEIRRFFVDKNNIDNDTITICGDEFLHLTKVLRHKVGYKIVVNNNSDNIDYYADIIEISKDICTAKVTEKTLNLTATKCQLDLYQAVPKGDKLDLIVQKSVELGINKVIPFISQNVAETKCNTQRLNRIALEASKQCGRAKIATVGEQLNFEQLLTVLVSENYDLILLPSEHEQSLDFMDINMNHISKIAIIIGSEGGFQLQEIDQLIIKALAKSITLGNRILRCETAAIATLAIVTYMLGEMRK